MGVWYDVNDDGFWYEVVNNCWWVWFMKFMDFKEMFLLRRVVLMRFLSFIVVGFDLWFWFFFFKFLIIVFNFDVSCCWKFIVLFWVLILEYRLYFKEEN